MEKKSSYKQRQPSIPVLEDKALTEGFRYKVQNVEEGWGTTEERQAFCYQYANEVYDKWNKWWTGKKKLIKAGELRGFKGTMLLMDDYWDVFIVEIVTAQKACAPFWLIEACDALKAATNEKHKEFTLQVKREVMRKAA